MPLLISDYLMQMAERVYGDAAATEREHGAATLARWIFRERPTELNVRRLQREEQLLGRRSAEQIRHAAGVLVEATLHNERFRPFGVLPDWPPWAYDVLSLGEAGAWFGARASGHADKQPPHGRVQGRLRRCPSVTAKESMPPSNTGSMPLMWITAGESRASARASSRPNS
jgi:hypothetical protein